MEIVKAKTILCLSIFFCLWRKSNCTNLLFQYDNEQCLNQVVEYQCTVTGSGLLVLTWRVLDNNGTELDGQSYTSNVLASDTDTVGGGVFTVEQLSTSPLVSNISFTVHSSINGYTIVCEDGITMDNENFTVNIKDSFSSPKNISESISEKDIRVSWMPPTLNLLCLVKYIVNSNITNSTINTTDTNVTISLDGLSAGVYHVNIAAVDTADVIGRYNELRIVLKLPAMPYISSNSNQNNTTMNHDKIQMFLKLTFNDSNTPPVTKSHLLISPSAKIEEHECISCNDTNEAKFVYQVIVVRGIQYSITALGENILGNGSAATSILMISTTSTRDLSTSVSQTVLNTPNSSTTNTIVLAIMVPFLLIFLMIIATVIVALIIFAVSRRSCKTRGSDNKHNSYNITMEQESNKFEGPIGQAPQKFPSRQHNKPSKVKPAQETEVTVKANGGDSNEGTNAEDAALSSKQEQLTYDPNEVPLESRTHDRDEVMESIVTTVAEFFGTEEDQPMPEIPEAKVFKAKEMVVDQTVATDDNETEEREEETGNEVIPDTEDTNETQL